MGLIGVVVAVVVAFIALLLGRELVAWYFKANEALSRLEYIEAVLRNIDRNLNAMAEHSGAIDPPPEEPKS